MVPMHGRNAEGAFHEPPFRPPRRSRPRPRLGGLSSRTSTRTSRFMVPMHGRNAEGAFHEPPVRSPGFSRYGPPEGGTPNKWRPHGPVHGPNADQPGATLVLSRCPWHSPLSDLS